MATPGEQVGQAGVAFGTLITKVGEAVGDTMLQLSSSSADTASKLATTQVDVIAVEETVYNDDGTFNNVNPVVSKLPLINFVDPVFYEWTNVRIQGVFAVEKLSSSSFTGVTTDAHQEGHEQGGFLLILGGGYNYSNEQSSYARTTTQYNTESSFGSMRLNALLQPKTDVGVPKPRMLVQGPQVAVLQGAFNDLLSNAKIVARTMTVSILYTKQNGSPIASKELSIETQGVSWSFQDINKQETDANGELKIVLRRDFIGEAPDTTPKDFVLSVRKGLVDTSSTVRF